MKYIITRHDYNSDVVVGYLNTKLDADKYCAKMNNDILGNIYSCSAAKNLSKEIDFSSIEVKYTHTIIYDWRGNSWILRRHPENCEPYMCDKLRKNNIDCVAGLCMIFKINSTNKNRSEAVKMAKKYFDRLISYGCGKFEYYNVGKINKDFEDLWNNE